MGHSVVTVAAYYTLGLQLTGFVAAYLLQTETFYDVLGGLNFLLLAYVGYQDGTTSHSNNNNNSNNSGQQSERLIYLTILFVISRGWLLAFLAWRAHSRKGDARFHEVIQKPMLFLVYWMVQGCWVFIISLPLLLIQEDTSNGNIWELSAVDWMLLIGFSLGIILEISSDVQKTLWIHNGRIGSFCRVGWWMYSRHPNYAGEVLQWWCAAGLCHSWIGLASPLFTMVILLSMSGTGIWNAEGKNLKRYYESENAKEYAEYRKATSPLIPMIGYGCIPLILKRWCLFEWERYEYKPSKKMQ